LSPLVIKEVRDDGGTGGEWWCGGAVRVADGWGRREGDPDGRRKKEKGVTEVEAGWHEEDDCRRGSHDKATHIKRCCAACAILLCFLDQ
jgi:hypothetical protein